MPCVSNIIRNTIDTASSILINKNEFDNRQELHWLPGVYTGILTIAIIWSAVLTIYFKMAASGQRSGLFYATHIEKAARVKRQSTFIVHMNGKTVVHQQ